MVLSDSLTPGEKVVVGACEKAGGKLTFDVVGATVETVSTSSEDRREE